jgi:hypothetical protein
MIPGTMIEANAVDGGMLFVWKPCSGVMKNTKPD